MSIYAELSYKDQKVEIQEVKGIQFSILSPEEIKKRSVVNITKSDTYTGNDAVPNGIFDARMGVLEHNKTCLTCEQTLHFCPGHFGHIELAKPVFHAMFFDITKKILKCVCYRCSRILISPQTTIEDLKNDMNKILAIKNNQKRWEAYFKLCNTTPKIKSCGDDKHIGCGARQPDRYNKEAAMKIVAEWKDKNKENSTQLEFTAEDVLRIFKRITEEDMEIMGFNPKWNRPEWMICSVLPVPPPAVRPSVVEENGQRRDDDLTHKLIDIIKTNNNIIDKIAKNASEETIKLISMVLQYHIFTFIDNQIPGLAPSQQRNGRKLKSICDRMRKKDGRIRGNLNGKRVDQSARSVITPDPYISIDELGVPIKVALNITFQEVVNEYNIEEMKKLILNGPDVYPGAKYIKKNSNMFTINLKYAEDLNKIANELKFGDVVHRHLSNGDYVLFNRQPSLHKMSMMCHKVIIMPYQTFRLNVLDTPPYNADFDGDEMNLHCPQNIQTMSELKDLAAVPYLILTQRDAKPSIEVVQDTLVGSFRLTKDYTIVNDKQMANLQMCNSYFKGKLNKPSKDYTYTGRELFSEILPPSLFINLKNKDEKSVIINNSRLIEGNLDKAVFHNITDGLIPVIYHDYGPIEIKKFLDNIQRLVCRWLLSSGFSIGISDLVTDKNTDEELNNKIKEMKANAYKKLEDIRVGELENNSIFNNEEFIEREILGILNQTTKEVSSISLKKIDEKVNRMFNMVKSGSKGKETNIAQIMACVGQQNVDGKRISYGFTDRTLPHFTKYDDGPEARGFVENSFISGLSPQEVFFHAMGGREGLIDTAVKSVTGDTSILIIEDGVSKCVNIGDWIDAKIDNPDNKDDVEQFGPEDANMEMLGVPDGIYIPSCDKVGKVIWGQITNVSRHDSGEILYKILTKGGRDVIVTKSKSLIVWNGSEFEKKETSAVVIGDCIPATMNLPEPPVINDYIDMSIYFPKNKYVYGTDLHKAKDLIAGYRQLKKNWWEENQGITFTVPYPDQRSLRRTLNERLERLESIKKGCLYSYGGTKFTYNIPDKFELNEDNGIFIGIFLADGCAREKEGSINITKDEISVRDFVKKWFDKYDIHWNEENRSDNNNRKFKCTSVIGYCNILAKLFHNILGHTAAHKYVPEIAYTAPIEFVKGLINGYFSGDGSIDYMTKTIRANSISKELIMGISTLLNRLGIFGKVSVLKPRNRPDAVINSTNECYSISIRAQWAVKFKENINLINKEKADKLDTFINITHEHINFKYNNDVVLDEIVEITPLTGDDIIKYKKAYDVSVPLTGNFSTRYGTSVMNTSETGYIQRRLVKAMEDAKINYDNTVRNASGTIVQYIYGEDGMDGCKIEKQFLPTIDMSFMKMEEEYNLTEVDQLSNYLTPQAFKEVNGKTYERCKDHFKDLLDDKLFIIMKVNKGRKNSKINYPIAFNRLINTAIKRKEITGITATLTDLTPDYVLDKMEEIMKTLYIKDQEQGMIFFHILLRNYLSPKRLIIKQNFNKAMFNWIIEQIYEYFNEAIAQPSEMVGVVSAQTIGEIGTQLTLDTFHVSGTADAVKATSGVPRLKEILSATKKTKKPILKIYMKNDVATVVNPKMNEDGNYDDERIEKTKIIAMNIKNSIEITKLSDILEYSEIYWDSENTIDRDKGMLDVYNKFQSLYDIINKNRSRSPWVLRMKFNKEKMISYGLRMIDVYTKLSKAYNKYIDCVYSDDNAEECIFRIRLTEFACKDIENKDEIAAIKAMEHNIVYQVLLKGYKGVNKVSLNKEQKDMYNEETGTFNKIVEWVLDTDGTNLIEILANQNIDSTRTISNDIREIHAVLGIEAARTALYKELENITGDGALNYRHLSLLIDTMTFKGGLMSIDRHGINRNSSSALSKSSFEESVDMLINGSIFSEYDNTSGISPQVMMGKVPNCGSGNFDIILDEEYMMELLKNRVIKTPEVSPIIEEEEEEIDINIDDIGFSFDLKNDNSFNIENPDYKIV